MVPPVTLSGFRQMSLMKCKLSTGACDITNELHTFFSLSSLSQTNSGDIDAWDPMKFDYQSPLFNSYVSGPGALLPNISPIGTDRSKKPISLFVDNIPYTCTKVGDWVSV